MNSTMFFKSIQTEQDTALERNQIVLDYVLSNLGNDQRPYLEIQILGRKFLCLLDSGASVTTAGDKAYESLLQLGLPLQKTEGRVCRVADGREVTMLGIMSVPVTVQGCTKLLDIAIVPELPHGMILGCDFWRIMNIVPNLKSNVWHFGQKESNLCALDTTGALTEESDLTPDQNSRLARLLDEKFGAMSTAIGYTTIVEHEIVTNSEPIKQRYYPVSPSKQKIIDQELKDMLDQGIVEPSKSSWSSPILLVPKKDGTYRFCVDYRKLNAVTKKDAYPIPYVSAILDRLRDARFLSSLDIKSAYWQVSVKESSREYTAFTVPGRGLYQFRRMPFGLTNAPATWQRLIDRVIGADLEPKVLVYLDDIIIISNSFDEHLDVLGKVFDRLLQAGLTVSREKCQFCLPELKYLGYIVDRQGLRTDPEKVQAILELTPPQNVKEVRRLIGMASWYRRFVPNFAAIIAPLTQLTRKHASWKWSSECTTAFQLIKDSLATAPVLTCPNFEKPFILQTDASSYGIGAVLYQENEHGQEVISFLSRALTRQERNYSTTERECLAVIWSVEKLRHYLEGVHFTVITDHWSLVWLHRLKDPTGRLARWAVRLQPFDFTIIHRKGKLNVAADFLSRSVIPPKEDLVTPDEINVLDDQVKQRTTDKWYLRLLDRVRDKPLDYPKWRIENGVLYKYVKCKFPDLATENDYWKVVVPRDERLDLIRQNHDVPTSGHLGTYKTRGRLAARYYWPKMKYDVNKYVRCCQTCAATKPEQKAPAGHMGRRPTVSLPWQTISMDLVGPLPRTPRGYSHILVVTDYFSKYVKLFPLRTATAKAVTKHIEEDVFLVYGVPQYLVCDNGVQMRSGEFQRMCAKYDTKISYTPLYYPRADPTERTNRTVKTMLRAYVKDNHRSWDTYLPSLGCAIRSAKHEVTGQSPYFVNFGREYVGTGKYYSSGINDTAKDKPDAARIEGFRKMFLEVKRKIEVARDRNERVYNLRRRDVQFTVGDQVWRRNKALSDATVQFSAKLAPKYLGPFRVKRKIGSGSYELEDETGKSSGIWHVQDLKPYVAVDVDQEEEVDEEV